jgi:hypothetical protein
VFAVDDKLISDDEVSEEGESNGPLIYVDGSLLGK